MGITTSQSEIPRRYIFVFKWATRGTSQTIETLGGEELRSPVLMPRRLAECTQRQSETGKVDIVTSVTLRKVRPDSQCGKVRTRTQAKDGFLGEVLDLETGYALAMPARQLDVRQRVQRLIRAPSLPLHVLEST